MAAAAADIVGAPAPADWIGRGGSTPRRLYASARRMRNWMAAPIRAAPQIRPIHV